MPVERFRREQGACYRLGVATEDDALVMQEQPAPEWLAGEVERIEADLDQPIAPGYVSEIAPAVSSWIRDLAAHVDEALILLFDYGLPRHEYYAPDRDGGWLRCHFRHRAHSDPLVLTGIQDITSWVDFTRVAEAGVDAGLTLAGYLPQAQFLLDGGMLDELAAAGPDAALALSREVKLLTLPGEMGEHFKCLCFTSGNLVESPAVFDRADHSHRL